MHYGFPGLSRNSGVTIMKQVHQTLKRVGFMEQKKSLTFVDIILLKKLHCSKPQHVDNQLSVQTFTCIKNSHVGVHQINVKILKKYVCKSLFFDKVTECRITTLLKMKSFTVVHQRFKTHMHALKQLFWQSYSLQLLLI